ncbi:Protein CBG26750 [Caenorhabditis briggsae]|uniref:Protein CBG26750 n=1 Tax=Caenorhabditis briggsae TaxID=6238 RepID=B6IEC5_CAEBR|nr:Protein CBG26750 [Caenorhabditis briggsae]CAS01189.1 Protein CBG26750 [Caenorhabditis briggsae]
MQFIATVVVASFLVLSQSPLLVDSTRFKVNVTITCWHRGHGFTWLLCRRSITFCIGNKDDQIDTEGVKVTTQETVSFFLEGVQEDDELYS